MGALVSSLLGYDTYEGDSKELLAWESQQRDVLDPPPSSPTKTWFAPRRAIPGGMTGQGRGREELHPDVPSPEE